MTYTQGNLLYEGKAKKLFSVKENDGLLWQEFKNSLTAFNGVKKSSFEEKGSWNKEITVAIFKYLNEQGIPTHFVDVVGENSIITKRLQMIPVEVVVRNKVAGSLQKKLNLKEGQEIKPSLVEFYYKSDELNDPFVSDDQVLMLKLLTPEQIVKIKTLALEINTHLKTLFQEVGIDLVDFKIEVGSSGSEIILADEISPDSCRLWDIKTGEKLDKDRFRFDLGDIRTGYLEVYSRLKKYLNF